MAADHIEGDVLGGDSAANASEPMLTEGVCERCNGSGTVASPEGDALDCQVCDGGRLGVFEEHRLELWPEEETLNGDDEGRILFYPSSLPNLLSVRSMGRGMRLTRSQATELRDYLEAWINA